MHALETKQASSGEQYRSRVRRRDPRDATRAAAGDATRAICCMMTQGRSSSCDTNFSDREKLSPGKTVPGHSTPRITQRPERQFTSGLMSVKDQEESFCTHQSACELSLWSLSYCSSTLTQCWSSQSSSSESDDTGAGTCKGRPPAVASGWLKTARS